MLPRQRREGNLRLPLVGDGPNETERAWAEFHLRLRSFVSRRVTQRADAEDIVQKVFLDMHRSLPTLRGRDSVGAWLHRTAANAVVDYYRAPVRRREVAAGATDDLEGLGRPATSRDGLEVKDEHFAAACLRPMVDRLPEEYRRAIDLVELGGLTQAAAAGREQISLSGMKSRVQRARRQLKAALLQFCEIALDARGGVMSCQTKGPRRGPSMCAPAGGRHRIRTMPGAIKEIQ